MKEKRNAEDLFYSPPKRRSSRQDAIDEMTPGPPEPVTPAPEILVVPAESLGVRKHKCTVECDSQGKIKSVTSIETTPGVAPRRKHVEVHRNDKGHMTGATVTEEPIE